MMRGKRGGESTRAYTKYPHPEQALQNSSGIPVQYFFKAPFKKKKSSFLKTPGFPGGSVVKCPPANAGDADSVPGLGRSPEEEVATHSSILACEIPRRGAWRATVMGPQRVGHNSATTIHAPEWQCLGGTGGLLRTPTGVTSYQAVSASPRGEISKRQHSIRCFPFV